LSNNIHFAIQSFIFIRIALADY